MTMQINVLIRDVYGTEKVYPVCGKAKLFAGIAGTTTLTPKALKLITELGYEITTAQREANNVRQQ